MNPCESLDARRLAPVIRAARKVSGKSQISLAREIGVSQAVMSRVEKETLLLSAPNWYQLCSVLRLRSDDVYRDGFVDKAKDLLGSERNRGFRMPKEYSKHSGSSARTAAPFLELFRRKLGENMLEQYFQHKGVDSDFFRILDSPISLQFFIDFVHTLVSKGALRQEEISKMTWVWRTKRFHGIFSKVYDESRSPKEMMITLVGNMSKYERNFYYQVEEVRESTIYVSVTPAPILRYFKYKTEIYSEFLPEYKRQGYLNASSYLGDTPVQIDHLENHFKGAKRCLYRISF